MRRSNFFKRSEKLPRLQIRNSWTISSQGVAARSGNGSTKLTSVFWPMPALRRHKRALPQGRFLARLRHAYRLGECPLIGEDRKWLAHRQNDAFDPSRHFVAAQRWRAALGARRTSTPARLPRGP